MFGELVRLKEEQDQLQDGQDRMQGEQDRLQETQDRLQDVGCMMRRKQDRQKEKHD